MSAQPVNGIWDGLKGPILAGQPETREDNTVSTSADYRSILTRRDAEAAERADRSVADFLGECA